MPATPSLGPAVAELLTAQTDFEAARDDAKMLVAQAQRRRETAMRRVAALGLSHRRIAELTGLSHTRVNQILGAGVKPLPVEAHLPPGFAGPPKTVSKAAICVMGEPGPRRWSVAELQNELVRREWPHDGLEVALVRLTVDGVVLSADEGRFTLRSYSDR
jgi:hypothetical protein